MKIMEVHKFKFKKLILNFTANVTVSFYFYNCIIALIFFFIYLFSFIIFFTFVGLVVEHLLTFMMMYFKHDSFFFSNK